jgi:hypothetical protein
LLKVALNTITLTLKRKEDNDLVVMIYEGADSKKGYGRKGGGRKEGRRWETEGWEVGVEKFVKWEKTDPPKM